MLNWLGWVTKVDAGFEVEVEVEVIAWAADQDNRKGRN